MWWQRFRESRGDRGDKVKVEHFSRAYLSSVESGNKSYVCTSGNFQEQPTKDGAATNISRIKEGYKVIVAYISTKRTFP